MSDPAPKAPVGSVYTIINAFGNPDRGNHLRRIYEDSQIRIRWLASHVSSGSPTYGVTVDVVFRSLFKRRYEEVLNEYNHQVFSFRPGKWVKHVNELYKHAFETLQERSRSEEEKKRIQAQQPNPKFQPIDDGEVF